MSEQRAYPVDLHTHSTASDGCLSPSALVERASSLGLWALALTDHDTVDGLDEAWSTARRLGMTFIPGVELSTDWPQGECHILGYFLDYRSPRFRQTLAQFRESRQSRGQVMVERLRALGLPLSWERVQELSPGGVITRAHVAEALLEAGYVASRQEAFERYIGRDGPAYVGRFKLLPEDAVRLIRQVQGVPVLAHPTYVEMEIPGTTEQTSASWPFLERLIAAGLLGLEAWYGDYPADLSARLAGLAERYGLIVTGGSDFHGHAERPSMGCVPVPAEVVGHLTRLAQQLGSPWADSAPTGIPS